MSEWGIALIAAGAVLAGSAVTGFYARNAGHRQAAAAEKAGTAQANALMATVQATLDEQRAARAMDQRRKTYVQFLEVALMPRHTADLEREAKQRMETALSLIHLEGPSEVIRAAQEYVRMLDWAFANGEAAQDYREALWPAESQFLHTAREALGIAP